MDEYKEITILLVESDNSGEKLGGLLKEFSKENKMDTLIFETENKLLNFLKSNTNYREFKMHYMVVFNIKPPLDNLIKVISQIKEDQSLKCIPIFLITLSIDDEDIIKSYNSYLNCYIVKPKDMKGLIQVVNTFKIFWLDIATLP